MGGARRGGRREKKGLVSEDSEGSSLDSSDNEFEEQIRKMKVREAVSAWGIVAGIQILAHELLPTSKLKCMYVHMC